MNWQTAKSEWSCRANSRPERPGPPGPGPNRPWAAFLILIVAGLTCLSGPVGAQEQTAEPVEVPAVAVERQTDTDESGTDESDGTDVSDLEGSGDYLGGAPLKTDPDLMSQLKRAEQYRSEGNWRVVAKLWQSVLDQSGDTLFSNDGETYFALTRRIESMLSELPPEGLSAYRISADADASEILAAAGKRHDLEALGRIVKGYFMSSLGDDAAFQLGCIYLDRYDFSGAIRMFTKIVDHYPDPSIPLEQVWLRIAVCYAYTGDSRSAGLALDQATGLGADDTDRLYQEVVALVEQSPDVDSAAGMQSGSWPGRLGGPRRLGLMPAPPDPPSGKLRALWQFWFSPRDQYLRDQYAGGWLGSEGKPVIENTVDTPEERVVNNWREGKWRPAGSVLFAQDKVLWKSGADLIAFDRQVLENQQPVWRTLWLNQFLVDEATETWKQMVDAYGRYGDEPREKRRSPTKTQEIQLFGDRIAQSMSIHRNAVYSIEGTEYSSLDKRPPSRKRETGYNWGSVPRRTRTNRLVAYALDSGKMLWSQPPTGMPGKRTLRVNRDEPEDEAIDFEEESADPFEGAGFMAAPVGYGGLILVPVNLSGSIWIYALDADQQGQLVWKSYLCDEPGGGSQAWSPIQMSLDGSTVYALCGTGVVFAVDAMTGMIRFARRHKRTGEPNNLMQRFGNQMELLEFDGWMEDIVVPVGNVLLVLASDYNVVWAIDRQSAEFAWRTDNRPFGHKFDYLIGIHGDYVYLGGRDSVAAISLRAQGRWAWVHSLPESSLGQALLTADALYVPVGSSIQKLGLQGKDGAGDVLATFPVQLGTNAPIGNLYSDGEKFWVVGGNRLYVLGDDDGSISDITQPETPADDEAADTRESGDNESGDDESGDNESGAADRQAESADGLLMVSPAAGIRIPIDMRNVSQEITDFQFWSGISR